MQVALWAIALVPLLGFWLYGLFDIDEGFYAAITQEMIWRRDLIIPHYNGEPWFEKPILLYWLAVPSVLAFGESVGPRLPSVLAFALVLVTTYGFVRLKLSEAAAGLSMLVLATSLLPVAVSRMMMTDSLLMGSLALALYSLFLSLTGQPRWRWLAGLSLGVAVLAKGPVGVALFAFVAIAMAVRDPGTRGGWRGGWLGFFVLFALVVGAWYIPAYLREGDRFVQEFLIEQNVGRFSGGDEAHTLGGVAGWIFYLPVLLVGMLPWSLWLPKAWPTAHRVTDENESLLRLCAWWAVGVLGLFTISAAKLPHYILPAMPPLAIIVGVKLAGSSFELRARHLLLPGIVSVVLLGLLNGGLWFYYQQGHAEVHALTREARSLAGGAVVSAYQMPRRQEDRGTGTLKVQETSHPSIVFYLGREVLKTDSFRELLAESGEVWILTRKGRIDAEEKLAAGAAGRELVQVKTETPQSDYALWRLAAKA